MSKLEVIKESIQFVTGKLFDKYGSNPDEFVLAMTVATITLQKELKNNVAYSKVGEERSDSGILLVAVAIWIAVVLEVETKLGRAEPGYAEKSKVEPVGTSGAFYD